MPTVYPTCAQTNTNAPARIWPGPSKAIVAVARQQIAVAAISHCSRDPVRSARAPIQGASTPEISSAAATVSAQSASTSARPSAMTTRK